MLLSEAFERYRQDVILYRNQSTRTEENHKSCLKLLLIFFGDIEIEKISFEMIRCWKMELEKRQAKNTVRGYIIKFRVVLIHCERIGLPVVKTSLVAVPKRQETVPEYLTAEEVALLIASCLRVRSKAIISLLYASGIRVSELINLNIGQINDGCFTVIGKGGKPRLCFLDERTQKYLDEYLNSRSDNLPYLFVSTQSDRRMSPTNVELTVKTAKKRAKICKKVTPHTMRHSFATNLLLNNTNMRHVQVMLGHESLQTTQMYTHVVDRDLQAVYREKHTI